MAAQYKGPIDCFIKIVQAERVMGLYKGIAAPAVGFSVINSIIFGVHGSVMHHLEPDTASHRPSIFNSTIAGGVAGAVQCSICSPVELVRIRMQIQGINEPTHFCLLYTSPSPRDRQKSRMPSSA